VFNPFITNLSKLSSTDLYEKVSQLQQKYFMTQNPQVRSQIQASIETYQSEIFNRKHAEMLKEQNNSELEKNELDKLIKVR
jgi:hypothetical protein